MYYKEVIELISLRISKELEAKIEAIAKQEKITKSDFIKEALEKYITDYENNLNPYKLGEELFGKCGSGKGDLSTTYKKRVRDKIDAKIAHWCRTFNCIVW